MAEEFELKVLARDAKTTKGGIKTARKQGKIPAILYGSGEPQNLWVERQILEKTFHKAHGTNALLSLLIENGEKVSKPQKALVKSIQRDVVYGAPLHIDFLRVTIHQKVEVAIPIRLKGESKGVKTQGGILEHLVREVKARCLASDIPEAITVDVTALEIGANVTVKDLPAPIGV